MMVVHSEIKFKRLEVGGWRQFDSVELDLHDRLTILTGANGAGKSTLLKLFAKHFGENEQFLATPQSSGDGFEFIQAIFDNFWRRFGWKREVDNSIGKFYYSNDTQASVQAPASNTPQYGLNVSFQQNVPGIYIDSHRPISAYKPVQNIPINALTAMQAYKQYVGEIQNKRRDGHSQFNPTYRMKEAIISMAMFGEGNSNVRANSGAQRAFEGFVEALRTMLPSSLGFERLDVRTPDIVLVTKTGEFMIDAASGGLLALIDLTWRIFLYSLMHPTFSVAFDEPENHLHPSLQKSLLPNLLAAFPNVQFIVATHSPFMVSSVKQSHVYVLRYVDHLPVGKIEGAEFVDENKKIVSEFLDTANKAGSASEVLREVLGVDSTMPSWVEQELEKLVNKYQNEELNAEALAAFRSELIEIGCEEFYPTALSRVLVRR